MDGRDPLPRKRGSAAQPAGSALHTEKLGHTWPAEVAVADVDRADHVAIVVPGARSGPDNGTWMKAFLEVLGASDVRPDAELAAASAG